MGKVKCKRAIRRVQNIVTMIANENTSVSASIVQRGARKGGLKSGFKPASEMESRQQNYLDLLSERKSKKNAKINAIKLAVTIYNKERAMEKESQRLAKLKSYENREINKMLKKEKLEKAA